MFLGMVGPWQILLVFGVLGLILPIVALIDIIKSQFNGNDKLIWVLVVLFLSFIGAILYFIIGRKQRISI